MKIVLFGGSGMVGQGVLRECLLADDVTEVVSILRMPTGAEDPKLTEIVHPDFTDFSSLDETFADVDACFYCLGVSAAGMSEESYRRVTYDMTMSVANALLRVNPDLTFIYVSGQGTNTTGRAMWAKVKGRTEDDLIAMSPNFYAFRPGVIRPLHGERSKTAFYRAAYTAMSPFGPLLDRATNYVTTTVALGRAMLSVARQGNPNRILENMNINAASENP